MKQNKPLIIWINCYGAWDPKLRNAVETAGYHAYLDGIVHALEPFKNYPKFFYLSGGMLDQFGQSECATTGPELSLRLAKVGIHEPISFDEQSLTTPSIVRQWMRTVITEYEGSDTILFCDAVRGDINKNLARYFAQQYGQDADVWQGRIFSVDRPDSNPRSTREYQASKWDRMVKEGVEVVEAEERDVRLAAQKSLPELGGEK